MQCLSVFWTWPYSLGLLGRASEALYPYNSISTYLYIYIYIYIFFLFIYLFVFIYMYMVEGLRHSVGTSETSELERSLGKGKPLLAARSSTTCY